MLKELGKLEREVMELLWQRPGCSVHEVCAAMHNRLAYTTVMTTLDRLFKKGYLSRRKVGKAFVYTAARSRDSVQRSFFGKLLDSLLAENNQRTKPVVACLVDTVAERDEKMLDELERMIREKRRQRS